MAKVFKQTQDKWCETWLTDEDLCDAVAVVGPERQRVPFIRAHLATISKPLKAALYGDWLVASKTCFGFTFSIRSRDGFPMCLQQIKDSSIIIKV